MDTVETQRPELAGMARKSSKRGRENASTDKTANQKANMKIGIRQIASSIEEEMTKLPLTDFINEMYKKLTIDIAHEIMKRHPIKEEHTPHGRQFRMDVCVYSPEDIKLILGLIAGMPPTLNNGEWQDRERIKTILNKL